MAKAAKPKVMKPAKSAPSQHHNVQTSDESISAYLLGEFERAKERLDTEKENFGKTTKRVMAKGLHIKAAKLAIAMSSRADSDQFISFVTHALRYIKILNPNYAPTKEDIDLFDFFDKRVPDIDRATMHGTMTAMRGDHESSNPYAAESKQGQAWIKAFRDGEEERRRIIEADAAIGDETLIRGEQAGEDDVHEDDDTGADTSDAPNPDAESEDDPVHAEFDAGDPGRELDPDTDGAALH